MPAFLTQRAAVFHKVAFMKPPIRSLFSRYLFLFTLLVFVGWAGQVSAQYDPALLPPEDTVAHRGFDSRRLFVGGNLGLSFGDLTYVNLSPLVGYRFSELFSAGVQINAQYESVRYTDLSDALYKKEKYGVLGAGIFGRIYPLSQFFIHLQPEMNFIFGKVRYFDGTPEQKYHEHVASFLAGGGYSIPAGRSAVTLMVLYDVLQNTRSPYGNQPIFRAGVNLGF